MTRRPPKRRTLHDVVDASIDGAAIAATLTLVIYLLWP